MRVGRIVSGSRWEPPGAARDTGPLVSVLLTVAEDASVDETARAARSILAQRLGRLELVVVDDSGSSQVARSLRRLHKEDARVGLVTHPRVVGLRPIALFEAYAHARADRFAFARGEDDLDPCLLQALHAAASERDLDFVYARAPTPGDGAAPGRFSLRAHRGRVLPQAMLHGVDSVPPSGVLVHRRVLDEVGLFDPHVAIDAWAEWDLWRRAQERFDLECVEARVGAPRTSATEAHSLVDPWLAGEWMELDRNASLLPQAFSDYDVLARPEQLSVESRAAVSESERHHARRFWFVPAVGAATGGEGAGAEGRLLVLTAAHDATATLCFDRLPARFRARRRIVYPGHHHPAEMMGASAVVFVRYLFDCLDYLGDEQLPVAAWLEWVRRLGVPHYYFLDDNLMLLGREEAYREAWGAFTDARLREELRTFAGVLLSSTALVEYFRERQLHSNLHEFPPIGGRGLGGTHPRPAGTSSRPLRVAFFGGGHRVGPFEEWVLPALRQVASEAPVELLMTMSEDRAAALRSLADASAGLRFVWLPSSLSYESALRRLVAHAPDVLLHPSSATANNRFKTLNVLLNALDLGAVPLVSDAPPYDGLRGSSAVLLCADDPDAWAGALRVVRDDPTASARIREALQLLCAERFDGSANAEVLARIFAAHPCPGPALREARARRALGDTRLGGTRREVAPPEAESSAPEPSPPVPGTEVPRTGDVQFRLAVPHSHWCGVAVRLGAASPPGSGRLGLRVMSHRGDTLREGEVDLSGYAAGDWLRFDFEPVVNVPGREIVLGFRSVGRGEPLTLCTEGGVGRRTGPDRKRITEAGLQTRLWYSAGDERSHDPGDR